MEEFTSDETKVQKKRLFLFKYRLNKLMSEQDIDSNELARRLNAKLDEDGRVDLEPRIKTYTLPEIPKEPSIFIAIHIARELGVDLHYLFGLDWGELIYPDPPTVSSLLINLFRAFYVKGIGVQISHFPQEVIIYPKNNYFEEFFKKIHLKENLEDNIPSLLGIIFNAVQSTESGDIYPETLYATAIESEFFKKLNEADSENNLEFSIPILWDIMLDAMLSETSTYANSAIRYPNITAAKILRNLRDSLQRITEDDNVSIKKLAQRAQLSDRAIEGYTNIHEGKKMPRINTAIDIACALDVSLEYLLGLDINRTMFPVVHTPQSILLNLFKALQNSNFKIREDSNHLNVAYTTNPYIHRFFSSVSETKSDSIKDAYKIISDKIDLRNLRVINGEIVLYDESIEKSGLRRMQFSLKNDLYNK